MTARRSGLRRARFAVGAVVAALAVVGLPALAPVSVADTSSASAATASAHALTVTVSRISPWTPATTQTKRSLTFSVTLRNTSDTDLDGIELQLGRGDPVTSFDGLSTVSSTSQLPSGLRNITAKSTPRTIDIAAGQTERGITVTTQSGTPYEFPLCLCANAVYPLYVAAYAGQSGTLAGFGKTFVASVDKVADSNANAFVKTGVAWVWPLIDRPHRTTASTVFTDDALTGSVSSGGRLDRALQVVEDVGPSVPITLMVDPDLIDELAVMTKGYTYRTTTGRAVTGHGGPAASAWLARLRQVLTSDPYVSIEFTAYADPALQSLSSAGLTWQALPATMRQRVETALGLTTLPGTLSWPPGGRVTGTTLDRIAAHGSTSVLIDSASVKPSTVHDLPATSATLHTDHGALSAALLSTSMQDDVATTMSHQYSNLSQLPHLLAQLALFSDHEPFGRRVTFLAAPRYVDPLPSTAETVIRATTRSSFSTPLSVVGALALGAATSADHSHARHASTAMSPWSLTSTQLSFARRAAQSFPAATSLFGGANATSAALLALAQFPRALQRSESAAWTQASSLGTPGHGTALTGQVRAHVTNLMSAVRIVRPRSGGYSYSLASNNSPLPVTVENDTPYRASVDIELAPAEGLPGITSNGLTDKTVAPQSKQTFRVQTRVQRSGRIELFAVLSTPDGHVLGPRVRLSVHSTVFGTVGLVITVVAAIVLLGALGLRYFRRVQRIRRKRAGAVPGSAPAPPPAAVR